MEDYELGQARTMHVPAILFSHHQHLRQLPKPRVSGFLILGVLARVQAVGVEGALLKRVGKKAVGRLRILT